MYPPACLPAYMHACIHKHGPRLHIACCHAWRTARRATLPRPPSCSHIGCSGYSHWVLQGSSRGYARYSHRVRCPCLEDCAPRIAAAVRPPLRRLDDRTQRECLGDARALRHRQADAVQRAAAMLMPQTACARAYEALRRGGAALGTLPQRPLSLCGRSHSGHSERGRSRFRRCIPT